MILMIFLINSNNEWTINESEVSSFLLVGTELNISSCCVSTWVSAIPLTHSLGLFFLSLVHTVCNNYYYYYHWINTLLHMTPTGIKTARRIMAVVERPLSSSVDDPPAVVTLDELTLMPPKLVPVATAFWMAVWVVAAALDPWALMEVTATLRLTDP